MEETFNYSIDLIKMLSEKLNNDELTSVYKYYKQAKGCRSSSLSKQC